MGRGRAKNGRASRVPQRGVRQRERELIHERVRGEWQGQLAERWGLTGEVNEQQFAPLSEGQHPATGEQFVRYQSAREYTNERGEMVRSMEYRAGWDATFSVLKSVSLTAHEDMNYARERGMDREHSVNGHISSA